MDYREYTPSRAIKSTGRNGFLDDFIDMIVEQFQVRLPISRPTCYVVHMRMIIFRERVSV
jgi:hypothetical protein